MTKDENQVGKAQRDDTVSAETLATRLYQQELLANLGVVALSADDPSAVFDGAVDALRDGLQVEFAKVLRLTPDRDAVRLVSGKGWIEALVGDGLVPIGMDSQAGYTLVTEQPVIVDDLRTEVRFDGPALLRNHGIVSGVSCIIGPLANPWGVLGAHTGARRNFNKHDANFVAGVANIIAQAVNYSDAEAHALEQELRLDLALEAAGLDLIQVDFGASTIIVSDGDTPPGLRRGEAPVEFFQSIHPDDQEEVVAAFRSHVDGDEEFFSATYRVRGGEWVQTRGRVVSWDGNEPLRFVGVHREVTDEVERRERERQLELQLQHAQKMEAVGRLAGGVAHDFNNILTAITGYVELLLEDAEPDDHLAADLGEIREATERARELTQQLLAFSRREAHKPRKIVIDTRLRRFQRLLSKVFGEAIELRFELDAADAAILIDPGQLEQLVLNIAGNARDAMSGTGTFTISTKLIEPSIFEHTNPLIEVTFSDDGEGMSDEILSKIFEPFFTTKKGEDGTGLGLALVYRVVDRSGGTIDVESAPGEGTTFRFQWPTYKGEKMEVEDPDKVKAVGGHERILFVEDDRRIRALGRRILERAGYLVRTAENPAAAWEVVEEHGPFDVVVSDVVMPGQSGPDFVASLRQEMGPFRVLFISGYNESSSLEEETERADVLYLSKPFTPTQLLTEIRRALT